MSVIVLFLSKFDDGMGLKFSQQMRQIMSVQ